MTAEKDWEFKCMSHGTKATIISSTFDYSVHIRHNTTLLTNTASFPDRNNIRNHSAQAFPRIVRYFYRILSHIWYHHRNLFDLLKYRYRISERLTKKCKIFD
jgi:2-hydroxy-3-keto-5-methylthiopentenyl-1-phosphate phosphatase